MLNKLTPIFTSINSQLPDLSWPEFTAGDLRTLAVLTAFVVLFALEARFSYREQAAAAVRQSYCTNMGVFILNDTLMSLLSVSSLWFVAERCADTGLLAFISDPAGKAIASFLLLDLALYFWHRANHSFNSLWMFHKVHHSDRCVNVSTAFRLHGVEVFLTTVVKAAFIVMMGVDTAVLLANEAVVTLFVMFHHTNITFRGEHWVGRLTIVPYLHRAHHSTERHEHDRNYGAVFSFWDRLFGTFADLEPKELGIKYVPGLSLIELVKLGLTRAVLPPPEALQGMIAEAAYFRAEKRGFAPGYEIADWLEAEEEILKLAQAPKQPKVDTLRDQSFLNPLWPGRRGCTA